jgi:hypothetical protein
MVCKGANSAASRLRVVEFLAMFLTLAAEADAAHRIIL